MHWHAEPLFEERASIVQGKEEAPQTQASEEEEQEEGKGDSLQLCLQLALRVACTQSVCEALCC